MQVQLQRRIAQQQALAEARLQQQALREEQRKWQIERLKHAEQNEIYGAKVLNR